MAVLVVDAADALRGEVHHEIAIVGGELAAGIHAASVVGGIVVDDAVFQCRFGTVVEVNATALGGGDVVADAAVGIVGADAVAHASAH